MSQVPNRFPTLNSGDRRLAIVGEAPGKNEVAEGEPFVGASGRFLSALLSRAGVSRESCFIGNVTQYQPPYNEIANFKWQGPEIQAGLAQLRLDLLKFQPNCIILLGNVPLKAAMDPVAEFRITKAFSVRHTNSVFNWRGSRIKPTSLDSPFCGFKCVPSLHPAYVLRDYTAAPLLQFDLKRSVRESTDPSLVLPQRELEVDLTLNQIVERLRDVFYRKPKISTDIEGYLWNPTMISIAETPRKSFIVPFCNEGGGSLWTVEEETQLWYWLSRILYDPRILKTWQNGLYDRFVLQYGNDCPVFGNSDDTMLKSWELYCELEKSLAMQVSIYTDEPYYKHERKSDDYRTKFLYCCKDSAVTAEINDFLTPQLRGRSVEHYNFNHELLNPIMYMELRGIKYDTEKAVQRRADLQQQMWVAQSELDALVGMGVPPNVDEGALLVQAKSALCFKRAAGLITKWEDLVTYALKEPRESGTAARVAEIGRTFTSPPTSHIRGELSTLLDSHCNVDSIPTIKKLLYEDLKLPHQTNDEGSLTTDYEALINLRRKISKSDDRAQSILNRIIDLRDLGTHIGMLSIHADQDERIRCGYNVVGSETGRLSCYTSPTGSGYNLQTIPKADRDLFLADPGQWFFQCDLAGADGWTVAAYCKMLGDSTMLDDYLAGLKPAKIICLMFRGVSVDFRDRVALREACKAVKSGVEEDWDYFACKRVQHGSAYLMGHVKVSRQIFKDSEGKTYVEPSECARLQSAFFSRYPGVKLWHSYTGRRLQQSTTMVSASGHRRVFFGRKEDMLSQALAHEPQANTTYATNLAAHRLWHDAENRNPSGKLIIEPLHQVHDALCGQFPQDRVEWAAARIRGYFDNPLLIAGQAITIPFEGGFGTDWKNLTEGKI